MQRPPRLHKLGLICEWCLNKPRSRAPDPDMTSVCVSKVEEAHRPLSPIYPRCSLLIGFHPYNSCRVPETLACAIPAVPRTGSASTCWKLDTPRGLGPSGVGGSNPLGSFPSPRCEGSRKARTNGWGNLVGQESHGSRSRYMTSPASSM